MNASDFLTAITHFFNDLIGAVIPGLLLLGGLYAIWGSAPFQLTGGLLWLALIAGAFCVGHGLLALHRLLSAWLGNFPFVLFSWLTGKGWKWEGIDESIRNGGPYRAFQALVTSKFASMEGPGESISLHDLRSVAMSVSHESAELGRRFMFISLFCSATSMAVLILLVAYIVAHPDALCSLYSLIGAVTFVLFYLRGIEFYHRALKAPFPVALSANLLSSRHE